MKSELCSIKAAGLRAKVSRGMAYRLARSEWRVVEISPRCLRVDVDALNEWLEGRVRGK
jgi:hypothetical protein